MFCFAMFNRVRGVGAIRNLTQKAFSALRTVGKQRRHILVPGLLSFGAISLATVRTAQSEEKIGEYDGERNKVGQRHGEGVFNYADGAIYIGNWDSDKRSGSGTLYLFNGEVLEGHWLDDELAYGTIRYSDGSDYTGEMKVGMPNGRGRKDGKQFRYYGQFKNGKYDGRGQLKIFGRKFDWKEYEGQFKDGARHGVIITRNMEGEVVSKDIWENDHPIKKIVA